MTVSNMNRMSVPDLIRQIFSEKLHVDPPEEEVDLIEAGVLDSFMFVELLLHLEEGFGVKITLDELEIDNFRSISKIASVVAGSSVQRKIDAR